MFHRNAFCIASMFLLAISFVGCGGPGDLSEYELPVTAADDADIEEVTSTLPVVQNAGDVSPAALAFELPAADVSATVVAEQFLKCLNADDRENFELLLTPAALNSVSKLKLHLPAIAEPNQEFVFSEPNFATIRQKVCFVDCRTEGGTPDFESVSLMMRKSRAGWRVAGMIFRDHKNDQSNLLSFENLTDLKQIQASVQFVDVDDSQVTASE